MSSNVGVMSTNHPSTVVLLLALARIGAVMVPVNPDYKAAEAGYVLKERDGRRNRYSIQRHMPLPDRDVP